MGTIGAMAPIAIGIADKTGIGLAIAVGAVVGEQCLVIIFP